MIGMEADEAKWIGSVPENKILFHLSIEENYTKNNALVQVLVLRSGIVLYISPKLCPFTV